MDPVDLSEDFRLRVVHLTSEIASLLDEHPAQAEVVRSLGHGLASAGRVTMFKVTMRAGGVCPSVGPAAAADIQIEFREHRTWHKQVTCTYAEGTLTLVAFNDFDPKGLALSDEFSDCISACVPMDRFADEGVFEVISVETV
jgi:hypothetical protein